MKKILNVLMIALVVCVLAIGVSAAKIEFSLVPVDGEPTYYDLMMNVRTDTAISTLATDFSFNSEKLTPVDNVAWTPVDYTEDGALNAFYTVQHKVGRNNYQYSVAPMRYIADANSSMVKVSSTCFAESTLAANFAFADGFDIGAITFSLKDGYTIDDIKPQDLVVEMIFLGIHTENKDVYGYNSPDANLEIEYSGPFAPTTTEITVPANSSVYFQDGTHATYEAETKVEVDLVVNGYVVVNTGYTIQTIYKVADGALVPAAGNALLGSEYTEIRTREPAGVRYRATITDVAREALTVKEYGFLVAVETSKLAEGYHLDMALVAEGKAKKGVAYDADTNIVFNYDAALEKTTFTAVVHGVDTTSKAQLTTPIAVRSYMITDDGTVVYGKITRSTVYDTAKAIKTAGGDAYTANKDFIDAVIKTVEPDEEPVDTKDNFIDISDLYAD